MKALTLIQPMGWAIVHKHKPFENRPRDQRPQAMRNVRTRVAIHNGAKWSDGYAQMVHELTGIVPPNVPMAVIGVATFTGRVFSTFDPPNAHAGRAWFFGPLGFEIDTAESIALATPVSCRGRQGFWTLNGEVEKKVRGQLAQARVKVGDILRAESTDGAWERVTVTATEVLQCLMRTKDGTICTAAESFDENNGQHCMPFQNFGAHPEGFEIRADDGTRGFLDYDGEGKTWEWPA